MGAAQVICNHLASYLHEQNMMIVDSLFFTRRDFAPFFFSLDNNWQQSEPSCDFSCVFCVMTAFCLWLSIAHQPACREKQGADWMPACEMFASGSISTPFSQDRCSISTFFFLVIHSSCDLYWRWVFFLSSPLLPPPSPSSSSSTLFVQTILFPSPHVQILNVFSPPSASSGKHLYAYEKRRERAEGRASKARAYQGNQAANICWQLLDNISLPLFEGGGGEPCHSC